MLTASGLVKKYGKLTVVNGVSLDINAGEVVTIIGPSGAGKSTLLHLLGSLDIPDAGTVRLKEQDIFRLSARQQARFRNQHLGFVFQFHHLLPEFSAEENVAIPLWIAGKDKKEALATAGLMLKKVGLEHRLSHKPSELSGGEQQRVAIARAIINQPSVLLADEPTGNLDSANARLIHDLFLQLQAETGQTIVMITHNEELARQTDRILVMRDGQIVEERKGRS